MPRRKIQELRTKPIYIHAVGKRKEAVARVRLYPDVKNGILLGDQKIKKGDILVNKIPIEKYFLTDSAKVKYTEPFRVINRIGQYILTIKVTGGGLIGQLDAVILGISRVLAKLDKEELQPILRKKGFLTRDARIRERRKVGMGGKARRKKQSPKR